MKQSEKEKSLSLIEEISLIAEGEIGPPLPLDNSVDSRPTYQKRLNIISKRANELYKLVYSMK